MALDVGVARSPLDDGTSDDSAVSSPPCSPAAVNLEKIIEHLTTVHLSQTPLTPDFIAALPEREKHYFVIIFTLLSLILVSCYTFM